MSVMKPSDDEKLQHAMRYTDTDGDGRSWIEVGPWNSGSRVAGERAVWVRMGRGSDMGSHIGITIPLEDVPEFFGALLRATLDAAEGKHVVD